MREPFSVWLNWDQVSEDGHSASPGKTLQLAFLPAVVEECSVN